MIELGSPRPISTEKAGILKLDWVYCLGSDSPIDNLSQEEFLLDHIKPHEGGMLLYINRPCMVMGKNQNPWWELDLDRLARLGIPVFRRISGGGTVFHDQGNVNYSFILPRTGFSKEHNLEFLSGFFHDLGLEVETSEKGDLLLGGKKISGNALCFRKNHALHHGTLLFSSDQALLAECLFPSPWRAHISNSAQVNSRPMETTNIGCSLPGMPVQEFVNRLGEYAALHGVSPQGMQTPETGIVHEWQETRNRHQDWEWVFGKTPEFTLDLEAHGHYLIQSGRFVPGGAKENGGDVQGLPLPLNFNLAVLGELARKSAVKIIPHGEAD